jgi:hypothetical protein
MKSEVLMGLKHLIELGFDVEFFLEVILLQSVLLVIVVFSHDYCVIELVDGRNIYRPLGFIVFGNR